MSVNSHAQTQNERQETQIEKIQLLGSNLLASRDIGALPVTIMSAADIEDTAAITGDELIRSIPPMGEVSFAAATGNGDIIVRA
jgi:outer membrane cobalamin receptor